MTQSHSVRKHLSVDIDAYDETIRRFIPGYEAMLAHAVAAVRSVTPGLVLDLGAGTGALSEILLIPGDIPSVELLDIDPEMLQAARERLGRFGWHARFRDQSFLGELPSCDAMMASLSLHHIPRLADKRALYARIHDTLWGGGVFANADVALPSDPEERKAAWQSWADHQVAHGFTEAEAWGHFEEWGEEDTYFTLDEEVAALSDAGFSVDVAWREGPMAVLVGRKS